MKSIGVIITAFAYLITNSAAGQYSPPDEDALEAIIVEKYYVSDSLDATDADGGNLVENSVTYRIFADLKPGYRMQAVYGNSKHELFIQTTTEFFNNEDRGELSGDLIDETKIDQNTVALDSWVAIGAATTGHFGIPKNLDDDGSLVGGTNNDGGSESIAGGLLVNDDEFAGIALTEQDGLIAGIVPGITSVGLDLSMFNDENSSTPLITSGGAWSVLEGATGPTEENIVLLGQFTTDGELCFELNIQIGIPDSLVCDHPDCHVVIQYVAQSHPDEEINSVETDNIFVRSDLNGCFEYNSSVEEQSISSSLIEVYPNPVNDLIGYACNNFSDNILIELFDSSGALVHVENIGRKDKGQIDISSLSQGVYMLRARAGLETASTIVIKQ